MLPTARDFDLRRTRLPAGRSPVFQERNHRESCATSRLSGESFHYLSPVRFLPSIMTLLKIRLIRVW